MTTEKHCKLQREWHTFAIFFRNLQRPRWKLFTTLSPPAWNLLRAKDGLWLHNLHKIASQVSMDMSHTGYFYFSCNSQHNILLPLQVAKLGCYTWNLSCNLSRNKKLQEKLPRVTWPLKTAIWWLKFKSGNVREFSWRSYRCCNLSYGFECNQFCKWIIQYFTFSTFFEGWGGREIKKKHCPCREVLCLKIS